MPCTTSWGLTYNKDEITEIELRWLIASLKADENVESVAHGDGQKEGVLHVLVCFKKGLNQPKNPFLQHIDKVNSWNDRVPANDDDRLSWVVRIGGEDWI